MTPPAQPLSAQRRVTASAGHSQLPHDPPPPGSGLKLPGRGNGGLGVHPSTSQREPGLGKREQLGAAEGLPRPQHGHGPQPPTSRRAAGMRLWGDVGRRNGAGAVSRAATGGAEGAHVAGHTLQRQWGAVAWGRTQALPMAAGRPYPSLAQSTLPAPRQLPRHEVSRSVALDRLSPARLCPSPRTWPGPDGSPAPFAGTYKTRRWRRRRASGEEDTAGCLAP